MCILTTHFKCRLPPLARLTGRRGLRSLLNFFSCVNAMSSLYQSWFIGQVIHDSVHIKGIIMRGCGNVLVSFLRIS